MYMYVMYMYMYTYRGVLLRIPADVVKNSVSGKILKTKARAWCVRRCVKIVLNHHNNYDFK